MKTWIYLSLTAALLTTVKGAAVENSSNAAGRFTVETSHVGFLREDPIPLTKRFLKKLLANETSDAPDETILSIRSGIEPTLAVNPRSESHLVAIWAQNPLSFIPGFSNQGGQDAGIAYTKNRGAKWNHTLVPFSGSLGGITPFIDNLWADYSKDGKKLYLTGIAYPFTASPQIAVTRSHNNGRTWDRPRLLKSHLKQSSSTNYDKPSVTADRNRKKNAYIVCDDFYSSKSQDFSVSVISRTTNYGKSWSPFSLLYDPLSDLVATSLGDGVANHTEVINNIIIVMPKKGESSLLDGSLLNFMTRQYTNPNGQFTQDIAFVRSIDEGRTWNRDAAVVSSISIPSTDDVFDSIFPGGFTYDSAGNIVGGIGSTQILAATELFSVAINPKNGFIYVAWNELGLTTPQTPQIALTSSRDGGASWSSPIRINRTPLDAINSQAFLPFIAVTKEGYVGILYDDFRFDNRSDLTRTNTDVWLDIYKEVSDSTGGSTGVGLNFIEEHRLSEASFIIQNAPAPGSVDGISYHQNGDYSFLRAGRKNFYAVYFKEFDGPFNPLTTVTDHSGDILFLDNNYRNAPFVSIVKRSNQGVPP